MRIQIIIIAIVFSGIMVQAQILEQGFSESDKDFKERAIKEVRIIDYEETYAAFNRGVLIIYFAADDNFTKIDPRLNGMHYNDLSIDVNCKLIDASTGTKIGIVRCTSAFGDYPVNQEDLINRMTLFQAKFSFSSEEYQFHRDKQLLVEIYTFHTPTKKELRKSYFLTSTLEEMLKITDIDPAHCKFPF